MAVLRLIKYQLKSQKVFYLIFFGVTTVISLWLYFSPDKEISASASLLNQYGSRLIFPIISFACFFILYIYHLVIYFLLFQHGKRFLIFSSFKNTALNIYLARVLNLLIDIFVAIIYFAVIECIASFISNIPVKLDSLATINLFKTFFDIILILSYLLSFNFFLFVFTIISCFLTNRNAFNMRQSILNIILTLLIVINNYLLKLMGNIVHSSVALNLFEAIFYCCLMFFLAERTTTYTKEKLDM